MADRTEATCQQCGFVNDAGTWTCRNCKTPIQRVAEVAKQRPSYRGLWALLAIAVVLAIGVWLQQEFERYGTIARVSNGVVIATILKNAVMEEHGRGASDLTCNQSRCLLPSGAPEPRESVASVHSDRSGRITVEYRDPALLADQNRLVLSPTIDGRVVDLSDPSTMGKKIEWKCGTPPTTVPPKLRPSACK